jgi:type II secretory pathway component GspD/PulD (secretin)
MKLLSSSFRGYVQSDDLSNTLSVTAPKALMERILGDIKLMDQAPRHVMLDARIVVMEHDALLELGVQWGWPQVRAGVMTNSDFHGGGTPGPDWPWGVQIGYTTGKDFTNSLLLTLNLLSQNESATVLASPQVMAQDGKEAQIAVNTEEYFEIISTGVYAQSTLQKVESGTMLKITPRIGEKGDITLDLATEVSDVIGRGASNLPVITRRTAKSTVRVADGGTAAVAGLMLNSSRLVRTAVPGPGNVPLLGTLFRKDADSSTTRQVAVFVTARLVAQADAPPPLPRTSFARVGPEFQQQLRKSLQAADEGKPK